MTLADKLMWFYDNDYPEVGIKYVLENHNKGFCGEVIAEAELLDYVIKSKYNIPSSSILGLVLKQREFERKKSKDKNHEQQ